MTITIPPPEPTIFISNPSIPPGALVLVTSVNGLIAPHVADQLLAFGYRVRDTVQSIKRCGTYLIDLFRAQHGPGQFELVEVPDVMAATAAWAEVVRGMVEDADAVASAELAWQTRLLEAATAEPTVRFVVFTSSAWAARTPDAGRKVRLTGESWNEEAVAPARDRSVDRGVWEWVEKNKPGYAFNTVLPETVLGECLNPANQGIPSTAGMAYRVWKNTNVGVLNMIQLQWFVDCRDNARLLERLKATVEGESVEDASKSPSH
ncbi:hypothetical protein VTH82DRAFT_5918 [Thermothelomyces myriococcoides]